MTEPKRWIDESPPEAIEHLLHAAASERPTEQSLARTLTVVGVGVGASGAAATAGAATASGAATPAGAGALGAASGAKAVGVLATSGLLKWGAVVTALAAVGVTVKTVFEQRVEIARPLGARAVGTAHGAILAPKREAPHDALGAVQSVSGVSAAEATSEGAVSGHALEPGTPLVADHARFGEPAQTGTNAASATARATTANAGPSAARKPLRGAANASSGAATTMSGDVSTAHLATAAPGDVSVLPATATFDDASDVNAHAATAPSASAAPPIDSEHLAEEVALVDRARRALASGDTAGALATLDEYERRFSLRKFAPEALYLRMEALVREGRSDQARSVAAELAARYPRSPHTARARQVLGQTIP
jgi:hypothetical protein